ISYYSNYCKGLGYSSGCFGGLNYGCGCGGNYGFGYGRYRHSCCHPLGCRGYGFSSFH
uniref:Keratin associated protein 19-6 n=1 Tax=Sus scrofa TaxID=9823 RepID=A0A8W4FHL1_PIG